MSKAKILVKQYLEDVKTGKTPLWARQTELVLQRDGSMRRQVKRHDGTVERDEIIPAEQWEVIAARAASGLSQAEFAQLLGVSKRTLQEWEQGRKRPSGAAKMLLKIATKHPEVLREALAA